MRNLYMFSPFFNDILSTNRSIKRSIRKQNAIVAFQNANRILQFCSPQEGLCPAVMLQEGLYPAVMPEEGLSTLR